MEHYLRKQFRLSNQSRTAFTLVELLVVIGIIALLIAILLPSLNKARKASQQTKCLSNMHQIGLANQIYAQNTGFYPGCQGFQSGTTTTIICVWAPCLRIYMNGSNGAFNCPSQDDDVQWRDLSGFPYNQASPGDAGYGYKYKPGATSQEALLTAAGSARTIRDISYGWNDWGSFGNYTAGGDYPGEVGTGIGLGLGGDIDESIAPAPQKLNGGRVRYGHIAVPSEFIVVADRARYKPLLQSYNYRYNLDPTNASEVPSDIHHGGANVLFGDGHGAWMPFTDLVDINDNVGTERYRRPDGNPGPNWMHFRLLWNRDHQPH